MYMDEKERKTEAGMDGQHHARLDTEGIVGWGDAKPGCLEVIGQQQPPDIEVGKNALCVNITAFG